MIINIISKVLVLDFYVLANSGKKLLNSCSVRIYKTLQTLKIDKSLEEFFAVHEVATLSCTSGL